MDTDLWIFSNSAYDVRQLQAFAQKVNCLTDAQRLRRLMCGGAMPCRGMDQQEEGYALGSG